MTTTTTEYTPETPRTRCGITAAGKFWCALGYELYSNTGEMHTLGSSSITDLDLVLARERSGHCDERALAWLRERQVALTADKTYSTALARLAEAGIALAKSLGSIDARLRVYINQWVDEELRRRVGPRA